MDKSTAGAMTVGQVVGENFRRLRAERRITQPEAVRLLRTRGLHWTRDQLASLESGRRDTVDLGTIIAMSAAFGVSASDWFTGGGDVILGDELSASRAAVRSYLSRDARRQEGLTVTGHAADAALLAAGVRFIAGDDLPLEADEAIGRRLGLPTMTVKGVAQDIYGTSATVERDRRLGDTRRLDAATLRARRGHVTREITREIETAVAKQARTQRRGKKS